MEALALTLTLTLALALTLLQRLPLPVKDVDGEGPLEVALHHRRRRAVELVDPGTELSLQLETKTSFWRSFISQSLVCFRFTLSKSETKHKVIKQRERQLNCGFCILLMFIFQFGKVRKQTEVNIKRMASEKIKFCQK